MGMNFPSYIQTAHSKLSFSLNDILKSQINAEKDPSQGKVIQMYEWSEYYTSQSQSYHHILTTHQ